jgi:hypothetical protein
LIEKGDLKECAVTDSFRDHSARLPDGNPLWKDRRCMMMTMNIWPVAIMRIECQIWSDDDTGMSSHCGRQTTKSIQLSCRFARRRFVAIHSLGMTTLPE